MKSGKVQGSAREQAITTLEGFGNIAFLALAHERLIDLDFTWLYYCTVVRFTKFKRVKENTKGIRISARKPFQIRKNN